MGHMLAFVAGDMIRRYLEYLGYDVTYIQNFTDIDDKIIARANEEGVGWRDVAERNIAAFLDAVRLLGILPATLYPRATEHVPEMHALIADLVAKGKAYPRKGDVYFRVAAFPSYGALSKRKLEDLVAGARVEVDEDKDDPLDFALWKAAKPGEPAWDSPWGPGRPGWHIECSAMAMKHIGPSLDLHGGGEDLIFPHHENEIAQSESATGLRFANFWTHNGWVKLSGRKMSKSEKHFVLIEELVKSFDPAVVRFYLLSTHYRSPIDFSLARLREAETALARLKTATGEAERVPPGALGGHDHPLREATERARASFREALDDDFNSARAIGHLFELAKAINLALESGVGSGVSSEDVHAGARALRELAGVLGLPLGDAELEVPESIGKLVEAREAARREKRWADADRIRNQAEEAGFVIEDRPGGPRVRRVTR
jgi:cysteinyl-tRNA synthetase